MTKQLTAATADKLLAVALAWLDQHAADYVQEPDSTEYRSRKRLLIASADELGQYVATAGSRRFFLALLPTLRRVEDFDIEDLLGEELLAQVRDGLASGEAPSADAQKLLTLVRPVLAHRALAQGVLSLSVRDTQASLDEYKQVRQNSAIRSKSTASY